jgi:hypothetical protein
MSSSCSKPYRADGTGGPSRWSLVKAIEKNDPSAKVLKSNPSKEKLCRYMSRNSITPYTKEFDAIDRVCGASYDPLTNLSEETIRAMATTYNERNPATKIKHIPLKNKMELCHSLHKRGQSVAPVSKSPSVQSITSSLFAPTPMPSAPPMYSSHSMLTDLQRCGSNYDPELHNSHLVDLRKSALTFNKTQPEDNHIKNISILNKGALCTALQSKGQPINMSCNRTHSRKRSRRNYSQRKKSRSYTRK